MTVPIEAKSFPFTPKILEGIDGAPVFTLRYGTRRDKNAFRAEMAARGATLYSVWQIREATLKEMRRLSDNTDEAKDRMEDTARRFWTSGEAHEEAMQAWFKQIADLAREDPEAKVPPAPENDFDAEEGAWIAGILDSVKSQSRMLGNMDAANVRYRTANKEASLAVVLQDAGEFTLTRTVDGIVERDSLYDLQDWLGDKAVELGIDPRDADAAFEELCDAGLLAYHLPKEAEKNFVSPPQPSSQEDSSKQESAAAADTPSTGSAKSNSKTTLSEADTMPSESSATLPLDAADSGAESSGQTAEASLTSQNA